MSSRIYKNIFLSSLVIIFALTVVYFSGFTARAVNTLINGWAWSSNVGWISLTCDHTSDGTAPPNNINTCADSTYQVNVDLATGDFNGYAWSPNIGWIDFDATGAPDAPAFAAKLSPGPTANCPAGREAEGWARAVAASGPPGWDGWIKMSDTGSVPYGVCFDSASQELGGFAWGGGDSGNLIGWIQFGASPATGGRPIIIETRPR